MGVFLLLVGAPFDNGLGGRLLTRPSVLGGCGKELMLTVFRTVFPVAPTAETLRGWGSAVVGAGVEGGRKVVEGARRPLLGVLAFALEGVEEPPVLLRVFPTGKAGRAEVGGPLDGRDALGSVAAMAICSRESPRSSFPISLGMRASSPAQRL